jgi:hypothetical protein
MKTAAVREFRARIVGFFLPATWAGVPLEIRKDLFYTLTNHFRTLIKARGLTEETLLGELEATRSPRRRR